MKITFRMTRREEEMRELLILPEATRVRYLEIFRKNLLGETNAANRSKVKNLKDVQFAATTNQNELVAYCDTTLVVDNPELGYMIYFDLVEFYFNRATGESRFFGYTRFVDKNGEGENKRRWAKRRKEAYAGSTMHFYRSLVQRKLKEEQFTVQNIFRKEMKREGGVPQNITLNLGGSNSIDIAVPVTEDSLLRVYSDSGYTIYEIKTADYFKQFPFLIRQTVESRGGSFQAGERDDPYIEVDGAVVTGQNYASATPVAQAVVEILRQRAASPSTRGAK